MGSSRTLVIPNDEFFALVVESLQDSGRVTFTVKGYSMYPFFRNEKDRVCVRKYEGGTLSVGDIILFRYRGKYVLHRIYSVEAVGNGIGGGLLYKTMGDGNREGMEEARSEDIAGVALYRENPEGGLWLCSSISWRLLSWMWMKGRWCRRWLLAVVWRLYR